MLDSGGVAIKKEFFRFRIFMFTYWAMILTVTGMYTMYAVEMGFSKKEISIAVTIFTVSSLIGQNILGYLADRIKRVKILFLPSISIGIIVAFAILLFKQTWQFYIIIFLWGFFIFGTVPLSEAWCIGMLKTHNRQMDFGRIRGLGSLGYGLSGILTGLLLQGFGWRIYYLCILIGVLLAVISVIMLSEIDGVAFYKGSGGTSGNGDISLREAAGQIIGIKPLRTIVIIVFLYNFVVHAIYSYLGIFVSDLGGKALSLGFTYFFDAAPEIITFFLTSRLLRKYNSKWLILMAFILQIIRLALIMAFNSPLAIILLGTLEGLSFGMLAAAYKTYIYELAPEKYKISCLSLSESVIGMAGIISVPLFGLVLINFGAISAIAAGLAIDIITALVLIRNILKGT